MLKYITDRHSDYQFLVAALAKMEVLLTSINETLLQTSSKMNAVAGS